MNKKKCPVTTLSGILIIMGIFLFLFSIGNMILPFIVGIFTGQDGAQSMMTGRYMILGGYDDLVDVVTVAIMLSATGLLLGMMMIGVIEPIMKHFRN